MYVLSNLISSHDIPSIICIGISECMSSSLLSPSNEFHKTHNPCNDCNEELLIGRTCHYDLNQIHFS